MSSGILQTLRRTWDYICYCDPERRDAKWEYFQSNNLRYDRKNDHYQILDFDGWCNILGGPSPKMRRAVNKKNG